MRVTKPIALFLVTILVLCNASVCLGSAFTFNMDYSVDNCRVNIVGSSGEESGTAVLFTIAPKDTAPTASLVNSGGAVVRSVHTGESGEYATSIIMPQSFRSGIYTVYANSEHGNGQRDFSYVNLLQTENSLRAVNSAAGLAEFSDALRYGLEDFGIPQNEYTPYQPFLNEVVFSLRPQSGYTMSSLCDTYYSSVAAFKIINGSDTFDNIIQTYAANTGIRYETVHLVNNADIRTQLYELMKKSDYKSNSFKDIYLVNLFLSKVNTSKRYMDMSHTVAQDGESVAGINLSTYLSFSDWAREEVLKEVFLHIPYQTKADFKAGFDNALTAVQTMIDEMRAASGQGGSSSGGSSFSVVGDIPESQVNPGLNQGTATTELFSDMSGHWAYEDVSALASQGVINGFEDGSFRPEEKVTRAEFVKMVVTAFDVDISDNSVSFGDVKTDMWHSKYIDAASSTGLVGGYDGNFYPDREITREDVAVILYRLLETKGKAPFGTFWFDDENTISSYSTDYVMALAGCGIIRGYDNKFAPRDNTKRCEAATLILRVQRYIEGEEI